jgi:hypothetical protein
LRGFSFCHNVIIVACVIVLGIRAQSVVVFFFGHVCTRKEEGGRKIQTSDLCFITRGLQPIELLSGTTQSIVISVLIHNISPKKRNQCQYKNFNNQCSSLFEKKWEDKWGENSVN